MPVVPAYPGVYVEETASGVHTISGVSTSVTAFLGTADSGPFNRPVRIMSFGDYEQTFGALSNGSELSFAVWLYFLNGGADAWVVRLAKSFAGRSSGRTRIHVLDEIQDLNLICLPGVSNQLTLAEAAAYCEQRRAFLIVDSSPMAQTPEEMVRIASGSLFLRSANAAVYYPWLLTRDPLNIAHPRVTAPCGAVAGLYCRTDKNRGVWKAPAGTDATLTGVLGLSHELTDGENDPLNSAGVCALRHFPAYGNVVWGARTLAGSDPQASEWKYIPVHRTALYIEESIARGTTWAVFEPNDEQLWSEIRLTVGAFMHALFRQGAFQGSSPRDAYLVKCDGETTTQADIDNGLVNILVGFAPMKPAEFVVLRIPQMARKPDP